MPSILWNSKVRLPKPCLRRASPLLSALGLACHQDLRGVSWSVKAVRQSAQHRGQASTQISRPIGLVLPAITEGIDPANSNLFPADLLYCCNSHLPQRTLLYRTQQRWRVERVGGRRQQTLRTRKAEFSWKGKGSSGRQGLVSKGLFVSTSTAQSILPISSGS